VPVGCEVAKEIREICMRLLTRREHSQRELQEKLVIKGFDRSAVQIVVDALAEEDWQSDERFAESFARYRIRKGFGPIKIAYELRQRGVVGFDLEPVVLDLANGWFDLLEQVYHNKYADDGELSQKEWIKRSRFLQQRGFSGELIAALFKNRS